MKGNETIKHEGKFDALYAAFGKRAATGSGDKPP